MPLEFRGDSVGTRSTSVLQAVDGCLDVRQRGDWLVRWRVVRLATWRRVTSVRRTLGFWVLGVEQVEENVLPSLEFLCGSGKHAAVLMLNLTAEGMYLRAVEFVKLAKGASVAEALRLSRK